MIQTAMRTRDKCLAPGAVGGNCHAFEYVPRDVLHSEVETALVQQFTHAYASLRMNSHRPSHACAP